MKYSAWVFSQRLKPNDKNNKKEQNKSQSQCVGECFEAWRICECVYVCVWMQSSEAVFEAVEQQDVDAVQILLYQFTPEELDLTTPNSEGLTPLDIALMTNNTPIARMLLRGGDS